jgi:uncharacterized protein RhaS with RHS repeats
LNRLGDRLRDAAEVDPADLDLLGAVLDSYDDALDIVKQQLRSLGLQPTDRLKTISTIVDKLRRERSFSLKTVQNLAGARQIRYGGDPADGVPDAVSADRRRQLVAA